MMSTSDRASTSSRRIGRVSSGSAIGCSEPLPKPKTSSRKRIVRWHRVAREEIREPGAWLSTTMTRLCIDALRARKTRREEYVGPWLPEPWRTSEPDDRRRDASARTRRRSVGRLPVVVGTSRPGRARRVSAARHLRRRLRRHRGVARQIGTRNTPTRVARAHARCRRPQTVSRNARRSTEARATIQGGPPRQGRTRARGAVQAGRNARLRRRR